MSKIVILADHTIGYQITDYLLSLPQEEVQVLKIYTNRHDEAWWKNLKDISDIYNITISYFSDNDLLYKDLCQLNYEYLFLFSWKYILTEKIISTPKIGCINLHYSLLPRHRGVYPVNWSIISGDKVTGVSFHWVTTKIDEGDIIAQKETEIAPWETSWDLLNRLDKLALSLFKKNWPVRNLWKKNMLPQSKENSSYHSYKDYYHSNELDLNKQIKIKDFINLLRGKSFGQLDKTLYFVDEKTGKRIYLSIELKASDEQDTIQ